MSKKRALIFGISGQDGSYLAQLLLSQGYEVHGTSRDVDTQNFHGLEALGIMQRVGLHSASLLDFRNLLQVITNVDPHEIYNLAGQTSVGLSFSQPIEAFESIADATLHILEVMRFLGKPIRFYNACSSECFGQVHPGTACTEATPFHPRSPYATAKATAYWATANYREAYGLFACSGILFNHESPLRPRRFVTRKIVYSAVRIARGEPLRLELGNLKIWRDWGYAPEYAQAMWAMLQQPEADDFIIATGRSHSLLEFLEETFDILGLRWQDHVTVSSNLLRPSDLAYSGADPGKARTFLGWEARTDFKQLVRALVHAEVDRYEREPQGSQH
jgi:GDPmannose 4,6-dehydratase